MHVCVRVRVCVRVCVRVRVCVCDIPQVIMQQLFVPTKAATLHTYVQVGQQILVSICLTEQV